jgi:hypothetical protein
MPHRHQQPDAALGEGPLRIAKALREELRQGCSERDVRANVMAGVVVGTADLPLAVALATALGTSLEILPGVPRLVARRPGIHQ